MMALQKLLAHRHAVIYKRKVPVKGQVCTFEAAMVTYSFLDLNWEQSERTFLHPYLSIGLSDRKYKELESSPDVLPVTGRVGISGLLWGLERVLEIKKFRMPIAILADLGDEKRMRAYTRLVKHGFKECFYDDNINLIWRSMLNEEVGSVLPFVKCLVYDPRFD
jgi:hypothetical protein